jgi:hypothetical protein
MGGVDGGTGWKEMGYRVLLVDEVVGGGLKSSRRAFFAETDKRWMELREWFAPAAEPAEPGGPEASADSGREQWTRRWDGGCPHQL